MPRILVALNRAGYNPDMKLWRQGIGPVVIVTAMLAGGCQKALFVDGTTRTQYERYQSLRGEYRPPRQVTALGEERPALRQRLAPLDQR